MRTLGIAVLLTLTAAVGCDTPAPTPPPVAAIPVEVTEARFDALDAAVKERKGKVVLVDFWATWCGPCVKSFPHLVATHKKYADKGLACMSVSMDPKGKDEKYDKDEVLKFLKAKDATFPNFVLRGYAADADKLTKRFGLDGGIPHMALFDKTGERVWTSDAWLDRKVSEEEKHAELDKVIETELAK